MTTLEYLQLINFVLLFGGAIGLLIPLSVMDMFMAPLDEETIKRATVASENGVIYVDVSKMNRRQAREYINKITKHYESNSQPSSENIQAS